MAKFCFISCAVHGLTILLLLITGSRRSPSNTVCRFLICSSKYFPIMMMSSMLWTLKSCKYWFHQPLKVAGALHNLNDIRKINEQSFLSGKCCLVSVFWSHFHGPIPLLSQVLRTILNLLVCLSYYQSSIINTKRCWSILLCDKYNRRCPRALWWWYNNIFRQHLLP